MPSSRAKKMIAFLKQNRFGRATFLPLTSVSARKNPRNEAALKEPGVIGIASQLVKCEQKYEEVAAYLGVSVATAHRHVRAALVEIALRLGDTAS